MKLSKISSRLFGARHSHSILEYSKDPVFQRIQCYSSIRGIARGLRASGVEPRRQNAGRIAHHPQTQEKASQNVDPTIKRLDHASSASSLNGLDPRGYS